jgi:integrase
MHGIFSSSIRSITRKEVKMGLYRRNKTGKWWMSFTVAAVQYRQSTGTDDRKLAGLILADMELKILKQEKLGIAPEVHYTFDDMMDKFMAEYAPRKAESTQLRFAQSLKHLKPFFGGMLLSAIEKEPNIIDRYMQRRLGELTCRRTPTKPATVNRELAMLSKAFSLAASRKWQMASLNPCSTVYCGEPLRLEENNERERYLINDEEARLLKAADRYLRGQLWEIIVVALYTGLRESEVIKLQRVHVDIENRKITVVKPNSKNKVGRTIPILSEAVVDILKRRLDRKVVGIQLKNDYVFTTKSARRISARNLQREFTKACLKAGIEDLVFHDLRHTFGTWLAQNGVDIYTIARYMGHRSLESTKRYLHHNADSLKAAIGTIEKMAEKLERVAEVET